MKQQKDKKVKLRLVPVGVFGTKDGKGLMDLVSAWSDCNRAVGHIYRVDDINERNNRDNTTIEIEVNEKDIWFFKKNWEEEKDL